MRNLILSSLILLFVMSVTPVFCQELSPAKASTELQAAFDKCIAWRQDASASVAPEKVGKLAEWALASAFFYNESMVPIMKSIILGGSDSDIWWAAVIGELDSSVPERRALACEILGLKTDATVIAKLGSLLDDKAVAAPISMWTFPQQGSGSMVWYKGTVGEIAALALITQTQYAFGRRSAYDSRSSLTTKATFDKWWANNKDYQDKIWYWAARWTHNQTPRVEYMENGNVRWLLEPWRLDRNTSFSADLAELSKLPKESALKILLLHNNEQVIRDELEKSFPGSSAQKNNCHASFFHTFHRGPNSEEIAKFINDNKLKPRLISLISQKDLWPEITSDYSFSCFVRGIQGLGKLVFEPADERKIAAAELVNKPFAPPLDVLILLRVQIAADKARDILTKAMRANPAQRGLAGAYISRFGADDPALILKCYEAAKDAHYDIPERLMGAAEKKLPVPAGLVKDILRTLVISESNSTHILSSLAQTANIITGKEVVTKEELSALSSGKGTRESYNEYKAKLPAAFSAIKEKVLAAL